MTHKQTVRDGEVLLDLPRTGDWTQGVCVTQTFVPCAHINQLAAVSLCVVLVSVNTFTSTLYKQRHLYSIRTLSRHVCSKQHLIIRQTVFRYIELGFV